MDEVKFLSRDEIFEMIKDKVSDERRCVAGCLTLLNPYYDPDSEHIDLDCRKTTQYRMCPTGEFDKDLETLEYVWIYCERPYNMGRDLTEFINESVDDIIEIANRYGGIININLFK